jgi:hypothetical protein
MPAAPNAMPIPRYCVRRNRGSTLTAYGLGLGLKPSPSPKA